MPVDIDQILQAFSMLGIPVTGMTPEDPMEGFMVEEMNQPIYWNDRKVMPPPGRKSPLWDPLLHVDETAVTSVEPKNAYDGQLRSDFLV